MKLKVSLYDTLSGKRMFRLLFSLNVIISLIVFSISANIVFPDAIGYWSLGESILQGKFSTWYALPKYYPDTLRTPGYPLFLAACQLISKSQLFVKVVQLCIYFASIYLCTLIIKLINAGLIYRNLFLILLIPNMQVVYYAGYISAEILAVFFSVLSMYLIFRKKSPLNAIALAFSSYSLFITRPAFLLFPFILCIYFVLQDKRNFKFASLFIFIYMLLLIPFGLWNKQNHGIFKITPIEGGAGVAQLGFWQLKLPDGYTEKYYWGNNTSYDYTKPEFYTYNEELRNSKLFEKEWIDLLGRINIYESKEDSVILDYMNKNNPGVFLLHNSTYTVERERALWQVTKQDIMQEPGYYLKSRVYHFIRYYVTGINYKILESTGTLGKVKAVYPFVITFLFIFLGLIFITASAFFRRTRCLNLVVFILFFWYTGAVHLPFSIQARYTIPIHLLILAMLSVTILKSKKRMTHE